ncbi:MAG TPA: hypothetical protein VG097_14565, partial [Gemmata sp.]|nr:hypothetical protein [Gemmata sp.]
FLLPLAPCPLPLAPGGFLSVALSRPLAVRAGVPKPLPVVGVTHRRALWSPDFPPPVQESGVSKKTQQKLREPCALLTPVSCPLTPEPAVTVQPTDKSEPSSYNDDVVWRSDT